MTCEVVRFGVRCTADHAEGERQLGSANASGKGWPHPARHLFVLGGASTMVRNDEGTGPPDPVPSESHRPGKERDEHSRSDSGVHVLGDERQ